MSFSSSHNQSLDHLQEDDKQQQIGHIFIFAQMEQRLASSLRQEGG
jgi:hypothetical protein